MVVEEEKVFDEGKINTMCHMSCDQKYSMGHKKFPFVFI